MVSLNLPEGSYHTAAQGHSLMEAYQDYADGYAYRRADPGGWRAALARTTRWLNLCRHSVMHFACHGVLDSRDFRRSRLKLNGDTALTVAAISAADLSPYPLWWPQRASPACTPRSCPTNSSACQAAFLELGASGVIASQWAVPRTSTMRLMRAFYQEWRTGNSAHPADALRQAQLSLRDEGENELERWAGFVYLGA